MNHVCRRSVDIFIRFRVLYDNLAETNRRRGDIDLQLSENLPKDIQKKPPMRWIFKTANETSEDNIVPTSLSLRKRRTRFVIEFIPPP